MSDRFPRERVCLETRMIYSVEPRMCVAKKSVKSVKSVISSSKSDPTKLTLSLLL